MIDTERLQLVPLNPEELQCYLQADNKLEKRWQLTQTGRTVSPDVRGRVSQILIPRLRRMKGTDYLFLTFWLAIEKTSATIVAELGFKGRPDKKGAVEIGYGTLPSQREKGFMTEAVAGMIQWARSRPEVNWIMAETDKSNKASIRVMEKNNFVRDELLENMQWWRISVQDPRETPV